MSGSSTARLRVARGGRGAILWGIALFVCVQAGFCVLMERSHPELRDPDYGCRLSRLQRLLVENPGRSTHLSDVDGKS